MRARAWLMLGLVGVQTLTLGMMSQTIVFPVFAAVAAVVGFAGHYTYPVTLRTKSKVLAVVAVVFAVKWLVLPGPEHQSIFPADYGMMHAIAQCLLVVQILGFYIHVSESPAGLLGEVLAFVPACCGTGVMICVLDFVGEDRQHSVALPLACAYALLLIPYLAIGSNENASATRNRVRDVLLGVILLLGVGLGSLMSRGFYRNANELDQYLAGLVSPSVPRGGGFSERATLRSISKQKSEQAEQVMLRVNANDEPGYLRAIAYETFNGTEWARPTQTKAVEPEQKPPEALATERPSERFFSIRDSLEPASTWRTMEVWPDASVREDLFMPLESGWVGAPLDHLSLDENSAAVSPHVPVSTPYRVAAGDSVREKAPSREQRERCLSISPTLENRARALALSVTEGQSTTLEKINAVTQYFRENYNYELGITVPKGRDALSYFLEERPAAHCEFFAAGATIALRLSGVPCRYVTGFVAAEWNSMGGYWMARNRDAHAWVEAWDDELGWITVEATPAAGVPSEETASTIHNAIDTFRFAWTRLISLIHEKGVGAVAVVGVAIIKYIFRTVAGWILLAILLVLYAIRFLRRIKRKRAPRVSPELARLSQLLREADRKVSGVGYSRTPDETLNQFARRIEAGAENVPWLSDAARWYRAYVRIRYAPPIQNCDAEKLRKDLLESVIVSR